MSELVDISPNTANSGRLLAMGGLAAKAECLSPEYEERLQNFAETGLEALHPTNHLSYEQALSLLVGFSGLDAPKHRERTFTFVYTDPATNKSNYQTACVPSFSEQAPFRLSINSKRRTAQITPKNYPEDQHNVRAHAVIWDTTNHHYSRVDTDFNEMPTAVIASPRSACAGGCSGCSRGAIESFTRPPGEYLQDHVDILAREYEKREWELTDLHSVNITTGSQPTEDREVKMMVDIMTLYREAGFSNARFMIYNYALQSEKAMRTVHSEGADGYIGTLETANDKLRRKYWGKVKGAQSFEDHLRRYEIAQSIGFPIIETNYVVGIDPYDEMMDAIQRLDQHGVAVVPNVKRSYTAEQLADTHSDVWDMGFSYISDAFDACLDTYRHPTIKRFAGEATIRYLQRSGDFRAAHFLELPIRHT
jgi:hypothetical protein